MARKRYGRTVGKGLAGVVLALVAYAGLQYHAMFRETDRAAALYGQGNLEEALKAYEGVESRLRAGAADIRSCHTFDGPECVPGAGRPVDGPERQHRVRARRPPMHPHALHALLHDMTDGALHRATANRIPRRAERLVLHPRAIGRQISLQVRHGGPFRGGPLMRSEKPETSSSR